MMVAVTPPFPRWDLPGVRPGSTVQGWMKRTSSRSVTQQLGARLREFPSDVAVSPAVAEVARGAGEGAEPGGGGGRSRRWLSWALKTERLGGKGRPGRTVPAPRPEPRVQTRRGTGRGQDRAEAGRKPGPGAGAEGSSRGSCRVCSRGARRHFRYSRPWRSALLRGSLIRQRLVPSSGAWLALPPGRATCVFPRSSTRRVRDVPLTEE